MAAKGKMAWEGGSGPKEVAVTVAMFSGVMFNYGILKFEWLYTSL